jgi:hypothetical protein
LVSGQEVAVRAVQLEEIETGANRHPRRGDELLAHGVHVAASHLARDLADR